ncbi:MAG: PH domain-containing protein [Acidimicrobiales bacterium]
MAFPRKLLNEGEEAVLDLRPHWWFMAEPAAALLGALILGGAAWAFLGDRDGVGWDVLQILAAVLIVVCLLWFVGRYLKWATTNFVVTTDRLIFRSGVLAKRGIEIPLERVNTVFFNQSVFERMIGAGDVSVESGGETGLQKFTDIRKPSHIQNEIYRQMEANENRKFDRIDANVDRAIGGAGRQESIPERIEQLDELRRRGVISETEFADKKSELLDRM